MNLLFTFIVLNVVNVILQTAKSICTVKCGKFMAAVANAAAYGLYTIVIIYTVCDLPLWQKVLIVAGANFIGVFVVKAIEQKLGKEKLWKVEMAIPHNKVKQIDTEKGTDCFSEISDFFDSRNIPYNWQDLGDWRIYNCYCQTKQQTAICQKIAKEMDGKISAYVCAPLT